MSDMEIEPTPSPIVEVAPDVDLEAERRAAEARRAENDARVERELSQRTRRGFITATVAAAAGYAGYKWLRTRPMIAGVEWPLRRTLEANESAAEAYFSEHRLATRFRPQDITKARLNGGIGLATAVDPAAWRLRIEGAASPVALTLDEIRSFPRREMITDSNASKGGR